jgi:ribosome maturation protein Sdo1
MGGVAAFRNQRRYLHLLERQSRQVLATIKFKFIDPDTGKEIANAKA